MNEQGLSVFSRAEVPEEVFDFDEHPWPWRVESDWAHELLDADGQVILKTLHGDLADELRAEAERRYEDQ